MAQKIIGIGSAPNDKTGDTLRVAGQKINDNFTELYGNTALVPDDTIAPVFSSAQVLDITPAVINVFMSENVVGDLPAASAFTASGKTVLSVAAGAAQNTFNLTVDSDYIGGATISITYTPPAANPLQDASANLVEAFTGSVTNNIANDFLMACGTRISANNNLTNLNANLHYGVHEFRFGSPDYDITEPRFCFPTFWTSTLTVETSLANPVTYYGFAISLDYITWHRVPDIDENNPFINDPNDGPGFWTTAIPGVTIPANTMVYAQTFFRGGNNDAATESNVMLSANSRTTDVKRGGASVAALLPYFADNGQVLAGGHTGFSSIHTPNWMVAKGWDGRPVVLLLGDSITGGSNSVTPNARADIGYYRQGIDDNTQSMRLALMSWAIGTTSPQQFTAANTVKRRALINMIRDANGGVYPFTEVWSGHGNNGLTSPATFVQAMRTYYTFIKSTWGLPTYQGEMLAKPASTDGWQTLANQTPGSGDLYPTGGRWVVNEAIGGPDGLGSSDALFRVEGLLQGSFAPWRYGSYDVGDNRDKLAIEAFVANSTYVNGATSVILDIDPTPFDYLKFMAANGSTIDFEAHVEFPVLGTGPYTVNLSAGGVTTGTIVTASLHDRVGLHPGDYGHSVIYKQAVIDFKISRGLIVGLDTTPPTLLSAVIANATPTKVNCIFTEPLNSTLPASSAFAISGKTVSGVAVGSTSATVDITVTVPFANGATPTLTYTKPVSNPLKDVALNEAASFGPISITNNVAAADVTAPAFSSALVADATPDVINITMSEPLSGTLPATTAFDASDKTVTAVASGGSGIINITVDTPYTSSDTITIEYIKPVSNPLKDASNNETASFGPSSVTNNISGAAVQTAAVVRGTLSATVSGTTDFTKTGFGVPDAAIIFFSNANTTNNPQTGGVHSIGLWDGTNQRAHACSILDNQVTTATRRSSNDSYGGIVPVSADSYYTVSSITDGIRLTLTTDNTGVQRYCTVLLLKGISAKVGTIAANASQNGTTTSASLGFEPALIFLTSVGSTVVDVAQGLTANLSFGIAETGGTHRMIAFGSTNGVPDDESNIQYSETRCVAEIGANALVWSGEVTTFNADNFVLTTRDGPSNGEQIFFLALGGAALSYDIDSIATRTTTGNTIVSTAIEPDAVLIAASTATGTSLETGSGANGVMFGLADDAGQFSHNMSVEDGAATSNANSAASATAIIDLDSSSGGSRTNLCDATVALNSTDYTLTYTVVDGTARKMFGVAFGT